MKKLFLVVGAAALVACMHEKNQETGSTTTSTTMSGTSMNEPAGAERGTNMMNGVTPARDINQQPYPSTSGLNQQRGSGSSSSSSFPEYQNPGTQASPPAGETRNPASNP